MQFYTFNKHGPPSWNHILLINRRAFLRVAVPDHRKKEVNPDIHQECWIYRDRHGLNSSGACGDRCDALVSDFIIFSPIGIIRYIRQLHCGEVRPYNKPTHLYTAAGFQAYGVVT